MPAKVYEIPGFSWTLVAGEDLTESQYCAVDVDSNAEAVLPADGGQIVGVLRNHPDSDQSATVVSDGIVMGRVGPTGCNPGDNLTVDTDGKFIQASNADYHAGRALGTGTPDGLVAVLLQIGGAKAAGS